MEQWLCFCKPLIAVQNIILYYKIGNVPGESVFIFNITTLIKMA